MQSDLIDEPLIGAIYGPAVQGGDWSPALERFRVLLNSSDAALSIFEESGSLVTLNTTGRLLTPELGRQYDAHYGRFDPKLPILAANAAGFLFNDANHFDSEFVARDPFYQEYSRPVGTRHTLDMCLRKDSGEKIYLAAMRAPQQGPFERRTETLFRHVSAHFLKSIELRAKFDVEQRASTALDALVHAILIVGRHGRVLHANRAAEEVVAAEGELRLFRGRLYAPSAELNRRLQSAITGALAGQLEPAVLTLRWTHASAWTLWVMPLPDTSPLRLSGGPAALVVGNPTQPPMKASKLAAIHGLTRAEAELALALGAGDTLKSIAARRGVKLSTVRTQLLSLLGKLGLHRQAELTRALAAMSRLVRDSADRPA